MISGLFDGDRRRDLVFALIIAISSASILASISMAVFKIHGAVRE